MMNFLQHLNRHNDNASDSNTRPHKAMTLNQRRQAQTLRTVTMAICVGLTVFFGLETAVGLMRTKTAVIATHDIARGTLIESGDLNVLQIPDHKAFASGFTDANQAIGKIAQIDIKAGDMLIKPMARASPVPEPGQAVVSVRIASVADELIPGQSVTLVAVTSCENVQRSAESGYAPERRTPDDNAAGAAESDMRGMAEASHADITAMFTDAESTVSAQRIRRLPSAQTEQSKSSTPSGSPVRTALTVSSIQRIRPSQITRTASRAQIRHVTPTMQGVQNPKEAEEKDKNRKIETPQPLLASTNSPAPSESSATQGPERNELCTLAQTATVITVAHKSNDTGGMGGGEDKETVQFAMSPGEAAKVMAVQERIGIMATMKGR
ncbi:Chaperone for flagella basal body P-ring formation [Bifidobacterium bohemicum]|uniref:SAF domain-containing protein n=1 Tax=Bifidobacterium bohemicum DSM 22767 TaxID=1437606 RepID=A0A086ZE83_9BIFI|nr:SAF domain-containing protein [Bifidobacterium bohemicum]KFI44833.1 SAF domain-containing protein [Bifidobacterium bohemicum DSM 22767]SCB95044.1 Chaperone for flagella basal body P-ring formation [Bifidobacterium bohemicum]